MASTILDDEYQDIQSFMPADMREKWAAVPKFLLYQMVIVGLLFGAGVTLTVFGFVYGHGWMRWGFAAAYLLSWLQNKVLLRYERRLVMKAREIRQVQV